MASASSWLVNWLPMSWWPESWILKHRRIPQALWRQALDSYPFLTWRSSAQQQRLRDLTTLFLAHKQFTPMDGLTLTDEMAVAIAAQACLPVLRWGLAPYDGFVSVIIRADQVMAHREWMDDTGVVHRHDEVLAGEAQAGGPIMLSWMDAHHGVQAQPGYNVVVHEFAHALDLCNGPDADGCPPLPRDITLAEWKNTLWEAFDAHRNALAHDDPVWLDPYAASAGLIEFFPVVCEAFFTAPHQLQREHPQVYALLCRYFQESPDSYAPAE